MNKKDIKAIIDELIALEPSLKPHKAMLEQQITSIISAKPDTKFTESFKKKLLSELRPHLVAAPSTSLSLTEAMNKWLYALGGAAVASFALYITVIHPVIPVPSIGDGHDDYMEKANFVPTQQRMMMNEESMDMDEMPEPAPMPMRNQGGGGRAGGGGGGIPPMADSRMIAPGEPYGYPVTEYVYDGDITLPKTGTSYKRTPLKSSQKADLLTGTFVDDMMNVAKLKSLNVTSVTMQESGDEPLMVNVDFNEGMVNINRQIDYSKMPQNQCRDQNCFERYRMKERDMLSEQRTIDTAVRFLEDLGIDLSQYGEPVLQDDWRMRYEMAPDKSNYYFPEQVAVTFPYLVDGLPVYDEWGNANGMSASVDMRLKTVLNVWGLRTMNFQKVSYDLTDDAELIREMARIGSMNGYMPEEAKLQKATLAEPRVVYLMQYDWNEDTQEGYEVYVPALAFPVLKMPEGSYEYRKAVVVPLAQELLDKKNEMMPPVPMPLPMPVEPMIMEKDMGSEIVPPPDAMMQNNTMMEEEGPMPQ